MYGCVWMYECMDVWMYGCVWMYVCMYGPECGNCARDCDWRLGIGGDRDRDGVGV